MKSCDTCRHADVCKMRAEYDDIYNIASEAASRHVEINDFEVTIYCKRYAMDKYSKRRGGKSDDHIRNRRFNKPYKGTYR